MDIPLPPDVGYKSSSRAIPFPTDVDQQSESEDHVITTSSLTDIDLRCPAVQECPIMTRMQLPKSVAMPKPTNTISSLSSASLSESKSDRSTKSELTSSSSSNKEIACLPTRTTTQFFPTSPTILNAIPPFPPQQKQQHLEFERFSISSNSPRVDPRPSGYSSDSESGLVSPEIRCTFAKTEAVPTWNPFPKPHFRPTPTTDVYQSGIPNDGGPKTTAQQQHQYRKTGVIESNLQSQQKAQSIAYLKESGVSDYVANEKQESEVALQTTQNFSSIQTKMLTSARGLPNKTSLDNYTILSQQHDDQIQRSQRRQLVQNGKGNSTIRAEPMMVAGKKAMDASENERLELLLSEQKISNYVEKYEMDHLEYEVSKREKLIGALRDQLKEKDYALETANQELDVLRDYKFHVVFGQQSSQRLEVSHANTKVALNSAYVESLRYKNENLERRFNEMEELLRQKDGELSTLQRNVREREEDNSRLQKEIQSVQFMLNVKTTNFMDLEQEKVTREEQLQERLNESDDNWQQQLRLLHDRHELSIAKTMEEVADKNCQVLVTEQRIQNALQQVVHCEEALREQALERDRLRAKIIELETQLAVSDQGTEIGRYQRRETDYQTRVGLLTRRVNQLEQDAQLLQQVRSENASLSNEVSQLRFLLHVREEASATAAGSPSSHPQQIISSAASPASYQLPPQLPHSTPQDYSSSSRQQKVLMGAQDSWPCSRDHWSCLSKWAVAGAEQKRPACMPGTVSQQVPTETTAAEICQQFRSMSQNRKSDYYSKDTKSLFGSRY